MTLVQLKYFQTVCRHGSITKAANELHISQPSLSNAMRELEKEFGFSLFHRLSRGMELTEEGRIFLEETDCLLERAEGFSRRMHELGKAGRTVNLGVSPMLSALVFPRLLRAMRESCPGTEIRMTEGGSLSNKEMVLDGKLDAAVVSWESSLPPSLEILELCSMKIFFYVSARHKLAQNREVSLSQLQQVPLALLAEDSFLTDFVKESFRAAGLAPQVMVHTNQLAAISRLVEDNVAAAFLYDRIMPENGNIAKIQVPELPPVKIRLIWNRSRRREPGLRELIRTAGREFSGEAVLYTPVQP